MDNSKRTANLLFGATCLGTLISTVLAIGVLMFLKNDLVHRVKGIAFVVEANESYDATLLYSYTNAFDGSREIPNVGTSADTLLFFLPKTDSLVKKFRLDLGNNRQLKEVKIKKMQLLFEDKTITLDQTEVFNSLFVHSASVVLDKEKRLIGINSAFEPFDPYIVFSPLAEIAMEQYWSPVFALALLLPFLLPFLYYVLRYLKGSVVSWPNILLLLLSVCIPLKIAWTTFCTLLLTAYALWMGTTQRKRIPKNPASYFLLAFFLVLLLFGRPAGYHEISIQLSLVMFALIGYTVSADRHTVYGYYVFSMMVMNAAILAAGIGYLLFFKDFHALPTMDYFLDIKTYGGAVRSWLPYDHAAFLSFFGLVGMLFAHRLFRYKKLDIKMLWLYNALLLAFILLVGARVGLLIFVVFLLSLWVKCSFKKRLLLNVLLFVAVAVSLVYTIQKTDPNRHYLWSISWEAIKERPWLGHGLGSSTNIFYSHYDPQETAYSDRYDLHHSHNQFLTYALELGIVGLLALALCFAYFLYRTKIYRNTTFMLFIIGLGYISLTESILETSKPIYVVCFIFYIITLDLNGSGLNKEGNHLKAK